MSYYLSDIIIISVIVIYTIIGIKKGLISTIASIFGNIISFVLAIIGAKLFAQSFANAVVTPFANSFFKGKLEQNIKNRIEQSSLTETLNGIDLKTSISDILSSSNPIGDALNEITSSLYVSISYLILFFLIFFVAAILLSFLSKSLTTVTKSTLLGPINSLLGGFLGFLSGVLICLLVFFALKAFSPALFSSYGPFSQEKLETTMITKYFACEKPTSIFNKIM